MGGKRLAHESAVDVCDRVSDITWDKTHRVRPYAAPANQCMVPPAKMHPSAIQLPAGVSLYLPDTSVDSEPGPHPKQADMPRSAPCLHPLTGSM